MIWHQNDGVEKVSHDIVQQCTVGEAPMPTANTSVLSSSTLSSIKKNEVGVYQSCPRTKRAQNMVPWANQ